MVVTKSQYALLHGVTPQAVTGWIKQGKITPPAVSGTGRIDVDLANEQLDLRLDPAKRGAVDADDKELVRLLRAERLAQAKITTAKMEREVEQEAVDTFTRQEVENMLWEARKAFIAMFDAVAHDVAVAVAGKFDGVDRRLLEHNLRQGFLAECRRRYARDNPDDPAVKREREEAEAMKREADEQDRADEERIPALKSHRLKKEAMGWKRENGVWIEPLDEVNKHRRH